MSGFDRYLNWISGAEFLIGKISLEAVESILPWSSTAFTSKKNKSKLERIGTKKVPLS